MKFKITFQVIAAILAIFIIVLFLRFRENRKIQELELKYQNGILFMNLKNWQDAITFFEYIVNNSKNYKNAQSLLDSARAIINDYVADSLLIVADSLIKKNNFNGGIVVLDSAKLLTNEQFRLNKSYYLASIGLLKKGEEEYRKGNYVISQRYAKTCLEAFKNLPSNISPSISSSIRKVDDIFSKSTLKLEQIQKERELIFILKQPNFERDLDIVESSWSREFIIAHWKVKIRNKSKFVTYKDISLKMTYWGESGTKIYESIQGHTEYIIIKPGQTKIIEFDDIMAPDQSKRAGLYINNASNY